jgi:hypothetical protein
LGIISLIVFSTKNRQDSDKEIDKLEIIFSDDMSRTALELLDNGGDLVQTRENRRKDVETLKREKESFEAEFNESKKKAQDAIDALDRG